MNSRANEQDRPNRHDRRRMGMVARRNLGRVPLAKKSPPNYTDFLPRRSAFDRYIRKVNEHRA